MILKNQLYQIERQQVAEESATFDVSLNAGCFIYKAHFPGNPITPGVCIVQIAKELLEEVVSMPLEISEVKDVKFLSILSPVDYQEVSFRFTDIARQTADDKPLVVKSKVSVQWNSNVFTTIVFICTAKGAKV